jgi:predicted butyrate kinase (DUF1464 family)
LFRGGLATIADVPSASVESLTTPKSSRGRLAWEAYVEGAVKAVASLTVSVPHPSEVVLSGRLAHVAGVRDRLTDALHRVTGGASPRVLTGFAIVSKQAAQGAALIADGLAGGSSGPLVETLGIRQASGTVLDHLYVISPEAARARLGIA